MIDSKAEIDARNSESKHIRIGVYFSQASLYLPLKGNHSVEFFGGICKSGILYFTPGPTYRIHDLTDAVISYPSQFKKTGPLDYELAGDTEDVVDIMLGIRLPHSLAVVLLNAQ